MPNPSFFSKHGLLIIGFLCIAGVFLVLSQLEPVDVDVAIDISSQLPVGTVLSPCPEFRTVHWNGTHCYTKSSEQLINEAMDRIKEIERLESLGNIESHEAIEIITGLNGKIDYWIEGNFNHSSWIPEEKSRYWNGEKWIEGKYEKDIDP